MLHSFKSRLIGASWSRGHLWAAGLLGACLLFYLVNNGIWLIADGSSPSYDKAVHAQSALKYLRLFEEPTRLSLAKLLKVTQYWPPFFHICSVPFTAVLGFSVASVAATNFLFLFVAAFSIFRIGRRLFNEAVGVGSVALTLAYPLVYAMSREVMIDFALLAMVALSIDLVLASDGGLNKRRSWLLGVAAGCAMLTKWTAVTFLLGPAVVWFARCAWRRRPSLPAVVVSTGSAALAGVLVAGPWYVTAFERFLKGATVAFGSDPAQEGDPVGVFESLDWYWAATRDVLVMDWLLIPTVAGVLLFLGRNRSWTKLAFLLSWVVPAMVFFVLIPNKDGRFPLPLLPAIALMAAAGLQTLPWKVARVLVWAFIAVAGVGQYYAISFGWPVTIRHAYTAAPQRADWKVNEIVGAIAALDLERPIACLPNDPNFEPNLFQLAAAVQALPVPIEAVGHLLEPIRDWRRYDLIISKSGSISPDYCAAFRPRMQQLLEEWMKADNRDPRIAVWRTWPLPDGSRAEVYRVERQAPAAPRVEGGTMRVYLGTYTRGASRGIYVLEFDPSSGTWTSVPALAGQAENPSFLARHPSGRFLYAVNEVADFKGVRTGAVSAFAVEPATGRLTLVNQQPSEGANPCHITIDAASRNALVANYTSGTVAVLPIARDGGLDPASAVRRRSGSGPVRGRQDEPHAHQIVLDASGRFAIWTDLGTDRVLVDRYAVGAGTLEPNEPDGVGVQPGSGPRHLAWHPAGRVLYLLSELSSTVSALRFDASRGALEVFQTVPARRTGAAGQSTAAEIAVSPDGRFLYTSNRGDDDIAVFAIDGDAGGLTPVAHVPTGGRTPRSFAIDPSGRWLVVANQDSSSIVVFRLDSATGVPAQAGPSVSVPNPVCVLFAPSAGAR